MEFVANMAAGKKYENRRRNAQDLHTDVKFMIARPFEILKVDFQLFKTFKNILNWILNNSKSLASLICLNFKIEMHRRR